MTDFKQIYSHQADRYEALVAREDYAQNLPRALSRLSVATVADNRQLPVSDGVADVSIAGWSFGHFTGWYPSTWRVEIEQAIEQLRRVLRPDGVMIIIETLGTALNRRRPHRTRWPLTIGCLSKIMVFFHLDSDRFSI